MLLREFVRDIDELESLYGLCTKEKKFPASSYNNWRITFEEHFIRAVLIRFVFPKIIPAVDPYVDVFDPEEYLAAEREKGMFFIDDFYGALSVENLATSVPKVLTVLRKKYL